MVPNPGGYRSLEKTCPRKAGACSTNDPKRDDESKRSHHALGTRCGSGWPRSPPGLLIRGGAQSAAPREQADSFTSHAPPPASLHFASELTCASRAVSPNAQVGRPPFPTAIAAQVPSNHTSISQSL